MLFERDHQPKQGRGRRLAIVQGGRGAQIGAADVPPSRSTSIARLKGESEAASTGPHQEPMPDQIDIVTDFDRGADRLPSPTAERLRERQRSVAEKRRRAQLNEGLLRFRVRAFWRRLRR